MHGCRKPSCIDVELSTVILAACFQRPVRVLRVNAICLVIDDICPQHLSLSSGKDKPINIAIEMLALVKSREWELLVAL